jgi:hypothetical protein
MCYQKFSQKILKTKKEIFAFIQSTRPAQSMFRSSFGLLKDIEWVCSSSDASDMYWEAVGLSLDGDIGYSD